MSRIRVFCGMAIGGSKLCRYLEVQEGERMPAHNPLLDHRKCAGRPHIIC
jgi:hypothetical protein